MERERERERERVAECLCNLVQNDLTVDTPHDELGISAFVVHLGDGDSLEIRSDQSTFTIDCQVGGGASLTRFILYAVI